LIAPRAKFWHWKKYFRRYGDPKSPRNKRRGHRKVTIAGQTGVAVPPDSDDDQPWEIDTRYEDELGLEEQLGEEVSGDDIDFEGELETQFDQLNEQDDAALESAIRGQSFKSMMQEIAEQAAAEAKAEEERKNNKAVGRRLGVSYRIESNIICLSACMLDRYTTS